ncbi:MAG: hypothetical protein ACTSWX_15255 [Promethearchaeota archaeon]
MSDQINVKLSNGIEISLDPDDINKNYSIFIDKFLIPYFKDTNDWNKTIKTSINEIERLSSMFQLSRGEVISGFLKTLENRLPLDIAELAGVDKIEILFENIDDYVQNIKEIISANEPQEEIQIKVAKLVENLNLFEIAELLVLFAKNGK